MSFLFQSQAKVLPRFIVFEGIDGAGKTTQSRLLKNHLVQRGVDCWRTAEPSHNPIGMLIRQLLRQPTTDEVLLADLFAVDRAEHLYRQGGDDAPGGIVERCQRGEWCLCDRYLFSALAYQGLELTMEETWRRNQFFPLPQWVVFLFLPVEEIDRRLPRPNDRDRYEQRHTLAQVQQQYLDIFAHLPSEVHLLKIDASAAIADVQQAIRTAISSSLDRN